MLFVVSLKVLSIDLKCVITNSETEKEMLGKSFINANRSNLDLDLDLESTDCSLQCLLGLDL